MIIELYKKYLAINNYSKVYQYYVGYFLDWCNSKKIDILHLSYQELCEYVLSMQEKKFSHAYINVNINAIRSLYRCLLLNAMINENVMSEVKKVKIIRVDKKIKAFITRNMLDKLVSNGMSSYSNFHPAKTKAILYFLFYSGLRKGEFVNLKREDINLEECSAIVRTPTKGKQERMVFFVDELVPILKEYFASEPEEKNAFNVSGSQLVLFMENMRELLPREKKKGFSIHTLRHSFARMLASNDIDMRIAQKLLGHKNLNSTLIYYDPDEETIKKIYKSKVK